MSAKEAATISRKLSARNAASARATARSRQIPDLRAALAIVRAGVLGGRPAAADPVAARLAVGEAAGVSAGSAGRSALVRDANARPTRPPGSAMVRRPCA